MRIDHARSRHLILDRCTTWAGGMLGWGVLVALAAIVGCGGGDRPELGQVEGVVRLNGKPLTAGKVRFLPAGGRGAIGNIQPDGTFTLGTYGDDDGALLGTHQVAIIAYQPGKVGRPDPSVRGSTLKPLVPERYLATGTSGLTFEVKADDNHPEFDLTSP